jgi:hypothetical protein
VHHSRKRDRAAPNGMAGDPESARGAQALVGAARVVVTLYRPDEKDRKTYALTEEQAWKLVRLDDGKANLSALTGKPRWFALEGVRVGGLDGFEVGAVRSVDLEKPATEGNEGVTLARAVIRQMASVEAEVSVPAMLARLKTYEADYKRPAEITLRRWLDAHFDGLGVTVDGKRVFMVKAGERMTSRICVEAVIPPQSDTAFPTQSDRPGID